MDRELVGEVVTSVTRVAKKITRGSARVWKRISWGEVISTGRVDLRKGLLYMLHIMDSGCDYSKRGSRGKAWTSTPGITNLCVRVDQSMALKRQCAPSTPEKA